MVITAQIPHKYRRKTVQSMKLTALYKEITGKMMMDSWKSNLHDIICS